MVYLIVAFLDGYQRHLLVARGKKNSIVFSICQHDGNEIVFSVWRVSLVVFCYFRYCYLIYIVFSVVVVVLMEFTSVIEAYHWRGDRFEEKMLFLPSLILSLCRQKGKEPLKKNLWQVHHIFAYHIIFTLDSVKIFIIIMFPSVDKCCHDIQVNHHNSQMTVQIWWACVRDKHMYVWKSYQQVNKWKWINRWLTTSSFKKITIMMLMMLK